MLRGNRLLICARLVPNVVFCLSVEVPAEEDNSHGCKEDWIQ